MALTCRFSHNAPRTGYKKGCRCERCIKAAYVARDRFRNPRSTKAMHLKARYGLTPQEREAMGNECEICASYKHPHVDHDHVTDSVRGILCGNCNRGIGLFDDSPSRLRAAAEYLERNGKK